jgi:hypothetical protein
VEVVASGGGNYGYCVMTMTTTKTTSTTTIMIILTQVARKPLENWAKENGIAEPYERLLENPNARRVCAIIIVIIIIIIIKL